MSFRYDGSIDATILDNQVDVSSDPAVKVAQSKFDRAKAEVARLENSPGDTRGLSWEQQNNLLDQNRQSLADASQAVEDARVELYFAQSSAVDAPYKAEREAAATRDREAFEAKQQAHRDAELARVKADLKSLYLQQPGSTDQGFEQDFPGLLAERNRRAVLEGADQARRAQFNLMREIA